MHKIPDLSRAEKRQLRLWIQRERDAAMRNRMLIILKLSQGLSPTAVSKELEAARTTVYDVAARFNAWGWPGLADRREDNGRSRVDESFRLHLRDTVARHPQDFGYARPTWTLELLCTVLEQRTGTRVSSATMSRALRAIGARLGRPRPVLHSPWPQDRQRRRARQIERLVGRARPDEAVVHADEVDIHLNPKIGFDWMLTGQQKVVVTPGKNVKRYLAGARDARTGQLTWVSDSHKRSGLFIALLQRLEQVYSSARVIHVIVDNYSIHSSRQTQLALARLRRIRLHFLPPYCPQFNPIERVWLDLHAEVTRNHRCTTIEELMDEVEHYLTYRNAQPRQPSTKAVA